MQKNTLQSLAAALFGAVVGTTLCIVSHQEWFFVPLWALIGGTGGFIAYHPVIFIRTFGEKVREGARGAKGLVDAFHVVVIQFRYSQWLHNTGCAINKATTILLWIVCFVSMLCLPAVVWIRVLLESGAPLPFYSEAETVAWILLSVLMMVVTTPY